MSRNRSFCLPGRGERAIPREEVEAKRQTRQLGWLRDAEGTGQDDRIDPFDVHVTSLRAGDVDARIWSRLALVRDAKLHNRRTVGPLET